MLVSARDFAFVGALDEVCRQPSPEQKTRPCGAEQRVDERVRVGAVALGVEQVERGPCVQLAAGGVEVAVDRQFCVTRRLQGALARGCRESLLATRDRRRAAFAPVVETGKIEQSPCLQWPGAIRDRKQDNARRFGVAGLGEVIGELEHAAVVRVRLVGWSQPNRQFGELGRGIGRAAAADVARGLRDDRRDRAVRRAPCPAPDAAHAAPGSTPTRRDAGGPLDARRSKRPRRSPTRTADA